LIGGVMPSLSGIARRRRSYISILEKREDKQPIVSHSKTVK
jgi:hypothetical protein